MKKKHFLLPFLAFLFSFLLLAGDLFALPFADITGDFSFTLAHSQGHGNNKTYYDHELDLEVAEPISGVFGMTIEAVETWTGGYNYADPIVGKVIQIGGLFTSPYGDPANPFQSLTGGTGVFRITDGTTDYLTGSLYIPPAGVNFSAIGSILNASITVTGISVNNTIGSDYLSELAAASMMTFSPDLTYTGTHAPDFLSDGVGVIGGKLKAYEPAPPVPEPSSLILLGSGIAGVFLLKRSRDKIR